MLLLAADLSRCVFSCLRRAMASLLSTVCSFWVSWPLRSPNPRMANTNSLEAPCQQQYQEVSWLLPSGRAAVGSRGRTPLPLPPRCSSQQLPAPLAFPVSSGMLGWGLDTRAGCATLLCQSCLLATRLWPGSVLLLASPQ